MKRTIAMLVAATTLAGAAGPALADQAAIDYRKAVMSAVGGHMKSMVAIVKGEVPHTGDLAAHATAMANLANMAGHIFPPDSDFGETRAKAKIWEQRDEFDKLLAVFADRAKALETAAAGGDRGAVAGALNALGKDACKSCHDEFREEKK